jgi:hypothetical protein
MHPNVALFIGRQDHRHRLGIDRIDDRVWRSGQARQQRGAGSEEGRERRVELGRRLAALRDNTPSDQKFGRAVRNQFGLDDPLHVAEMMRVARRYGERPEIFSKAAGAS